MDFDFLWVLNDKDIKVELLDKVAFLSTKPILCGISVIKAPKVPFFLYFVHRNSSPFRRLEPILGKNWGRTDCSTVQ